MVREYGFGDLLADTHDRVKGGHGLLENHGDARAAKLPQLIGRQGGETHVDAVAILHVVLGNAVLENDVARDDGRGRKQAHDGERGDGFSRAGFADQAEDFPMLDGE